MIFEMVPSKTRSFYQDEGFEKMRVVRSGITSVDHQKRLFKKVDVTVVHGNN